MSVFVLIHFKDYYCWYWSVETCWCFSIYLCTKCMFPVFKFKSGTFDSINNCITSELVVLQLEQTSMYISDEFESELKTQRYSISRSPSWLVIMKTCRPWAVYMIFQNVSTYWLDNSDWFTKKKRGKKSTARAKDWSPINFSTLVFSGDIPALYFAFSVVIDGVKYKTGMGTNKKEARHQAGVLALEELLPTLETEKSVLPETSG